MALALGLLLLIEGASPTAAWNRQTSVFLKSLAQELRARPTEMSPALVATRLDDGRNSTERLHLPGAAKALSVRTEGGQQTRRHGTPGGRKRREDGVIGMGGCYLFDALFQNPQAAV